MKKKVIYLILAIFLFSHPAAIFASEIFYNTALIPNDAYFSKQWYLKKINAISAWDIEGSKKDVTVAVIDSGVQINHPDLRDNIWLNKDEIPNNNIDDDNNGYVDDVNGWDFINDTSDPNPKLTIDFIDYEITHGTVVAGIITASTNNQEGVSGVARSVKIMPLLVLDSKGAGNSSSVIRAIEYATKNGADVINLSFAGNVYSPALEVAIRNAYKQGIIIVAAAGNDKEAHSLDEHPMYPVCNDGYNYENLVIGVAATDALDQKASFSAYGNKCVDISAPGVSIYNTSFYSPRRENGELVLNKYYDGYWSGTSMATPQVSGVIAQIISTNPSLSRDEVVNILLGSSDYIEKLNPDYKNKLGAGRLNSYRAVYMAKENLDKQSVYFINSAYSDRKSSIKITNKNGNLVSEFDVLDGYYGGINISSADLDGDNKDEIIVSPKDSGGPQVQVFSPDGRLLSQFFAYDEKFRGGVDIATIDIDNNGIYEIITGAGAGGGPHVRVFNKDGGLLRQFFAYDQNFTGGVKVASADVNGDNVTEIVTAPGEGGGPQVKIFDTKGNLLNNFFAFSEGFRGGLNLSLADIDGGIRKKNEIIVSKASHGKSEIKIFDYFGKELSSFSAFGDKYKDRVNINTGDVDLDGQDEIICGAGPGGTPHVRIFESNGELIGAFYSFEETFNGGVISNILIK